MGLGSEFAKLAAKSGFNPILVARSQEKLEDLARELETQYKVEVTVIPLDLTSPTAPQEILRRIEEKGSNVEILINNAGFGTSGPFDKSPLEKELGMVNLNISALVALTHLFIHHMKKQGHGRILNIASAAGFQPGPNMAVYFATKAFVVSFSQAITHELRDTGISVTAHCPGATATEFAKTADIQEATLFKLTVAEKTAVATHGWKAMLKGKPLAIHGSINQLGVFLNRFSPRSLVVKVASQVTAKR